MKFLYIIDLCAIAVFCFSYYWNCYRKGYRIDIWHVQLFLICVLVNQIMLPFSLSELNVVVTGSDTDAVIAAVPHVFLVAILGYVMVLAGGALWRLNLGIGFRQVASSLLEVIPRCSRMVMSSKTLLICHTALCILLQISILGFYFAKNGFGFDLRAFTFADPSLRPVALVISNYSIIVGSHSFARYMEKKEPSLLLCTALLTVGMVFFGARANILAIYFNVMLCYFVLRGRRVGIFRLAVLGIGGILAALYLGSLRAGEYSLSTFATSLVVQIFFGDTFSDLRDFAWVYSAWDGVLWMGKTYLAALMSFIPRWISPFRDTWSLGVQTASIVGFDPNVHPGLRPGYFGESYFNFGYIGVMAIGLLIGVVTMRVDIGVKRSLAGPKPSMMKAFSYTVLLGVMSAFAVTAGASGLYILVGVYAFSWVGLRLLALFSPGHSAKLADLH